MAVCTAPAAGTTWTDINDFSACRRTCDSGGDIDPCEWLCPTAPSEAKEPKTAAHRISAGPHKLNGDGHSPTK
ncbi:Hypothetical predicted protein, partial [Pelobates cultripes]